MRTDAMGEAGLAMRAIWIAGAAMALMATPATATVKLGVEKWQAGDYAAAVTYWLPLAARGDPDALFNMGQAYKLGRGVEKSDRNAIDYFRKAAAKGHEAAQERLGLALYADAATRAEALRWLETAARADQPRAQYVLGVAYFNGDDVVKNWPLAYGFALRANAQNVPQAAAALATMNANLSIGERQQGEAIAQSLAAGTGVPGIPGPTPPVAIASAAPPTARPAPVPAAARPAAAGDWRVQLGAFSGRKAAGDAWTKLSASQPSILGGQSPIYVDVGAVTRLQVGPFATRDAARALCSRLSAAGKTCFVAPGT